MKPRPKVVLPEPGGATTMSHYTANLRDLEFNPAAPGQLVQAVPGVRSARYSEPQPGWTRKPIDAAGRFGTWGGVGYDRWHHGRSGVGIALDDEHLPGLRAHVQHQGADRIHLRVREVGQQRAAAGVQGDELAVEGRV